MDTSRDIKTLCGRLERRANVVARIVSGRARTNSRKLAGLDEAVQRHRNKALLSIAYTYAKVVRGYKGDDPTKGLNVRVEEKPRDRYVSDAELDGIIAKASPKLAGIARFIELTGMRQVDALTVKVADLDDDGFVYWNSKSKKWQGLDWSPELEAVVDDAKVLWRRFGR